MRVLEVTCWLPEGKMGGGGAVVARDNALALQRLGAEVRVFAGDYTATRPRLTLWDDDSAGVPVTRLALEDRDRHTPLWRKRNPEAAAAFGHHLDADRPDVAHFHALQGLGFHCLTEAVRRGIPAAVTLHDHWWVSPLRFLTNLRTGHLAWSAGCWETLRCRLRRRSPPALAEDLRPTGTSVAEIPVYTEFSSPLGEIREAMHTLGPLRRVLAQADLIIGPSEFVSDVHRRAGIGNLTLLRNAAPCEASAIVRRSPVEGPLRFGFMGGTDRWKGVRRALRAIREFTPNEAELSLWGTDEAPADSLAQGPNIHWCGRLSAERRLEAQAEMDVLLALSLHHENSPLIVIEAQAAGTPIIATGVGGHRELIRDGVDGFLVPRENLGALIAVMRRLVDDRSLVQRLSSAAPQRPTDEGHAHELHALLEDLAKRGRPA